MGRAGQSLLFVLPEETQYIQHLHDANLTLLPLNLKYDQGIQVCALLIGRLDLTICL